MLTLLRLPVIRDTTAGRDSLGYALVSHDVHGLYTVYNYGL